jgi:NAD(P)-dependent dehydrogenase (short-subunit alcohol dehydrogenase family)
VAAMRKPVDLGKDVQVIAIDISDDESVKAAAKLVKEAVRIFGSGFMQSCSFLLRTDCFSSRGSGLISYSQDTLIVNAAIGEDLKLLTTSSQELTRYLDINVLGPHRVVRAFLPALRARQTRKIVLISSTSGSNTKQIGNKGGFSGPYSVSKAAENMLAVQFHNELHYEEGFTVVPIRKSTGSSGPFRTSVCLPSNSSETNRAHHFPMYLVVKFRPGLGGECFFFTASLITLAPHSRAICTGHRHGTFNRPRRPFQRRNHG